MLRLFADLSLAACLDFSYAAAMSRPLLLLVLAALTAQGVGQQLSLGLVSGGFNQPVFATAPAGDSRLFVVEKGGTIDIVQNGAVLPTPFLNISGILNASGERGLLGLAFDPAYATNGRFYVNYIDATTLNTVVARYQVSPTNPNLANPASAQTIITIAQPAGRSNHKAGWIDFRPGEPGNLYIATGDGGASNDPENRAQNLNDNLGKILRIDVSGSTAGYSIPAGNPFAGTTAGNDEIWAYGLRNPFRNSFDRANGNFYIADVGQDTREEIDFALGTSAGGLNFGWRAREGSGDNPGVGDAAPANAVGPIFDYLHSAQPSGAASITGGYVYRGTAIPGLQGTYFFGDFLSGQINSFTYDGLSLTNFQNRTPQLDPSGTRLGGSVLASFGQDATGELYVVDISGELYKIIPEPSSALLLASGGLLACARQRRRSHSTR
ncbi:MAG: hypothetical protein JWQ44_776 [Chthoniobacter sp.]|nr:hypothetical protein [Chthoniobacter sp.]